MVRQYVGSSDEERKALVSRTQSGDLTISNREMFEAFKIDPDYDAYGVPLDKMDPVHPALFARCAVWLHAVHRRWAA